MASTSESQRRSPRNPNSNPLAFLGLKRVGQDITEEELMAESGSGRSPSKIELNRRGIPARKRKKNSLIYGTDEVVEIPVRSPKKRTINKTPVSSPIKNPIAIKKEQDGISSPQSSTKKNANKRSTPQVTPVSTPEIKKLSNAPMSPAKKATRGNPISSPKGSSSPFKLGRRELDKKKFEQESELSTPERKAAQVLGAALRNLLKLPKGHKWVCYEFFYSNIDKVLFEGENDFMVCLRESFPQLKTRKLTRVEWCKIRRLMGKPRRCSSAFFGEERSELARKRHKIRLLQQRKQADITNFKDLPDNIPLQLTIGARVTARLRVPQDGLFIGTVDAYDTSNNTYRITFERSGLGTHSIPDYEVLSTQDADTMPLSTFTARSRPRPLMQSNSSTPSYLSPMKYGSTYSPGLQNDPLLSGTTPRGKILRMEGHLGGYPVKFLEQIVRLSKCLKLKREKVSSLKELNSLGERRKSFGDFINEDFQRKYAANVIDLSHINRDLNQHLQSIKEFTQEVASEAGPTISLPNIIREGCQEDAYNLVNKSNTMEEKEYVENPKLLALISSLTALMIQVKQIAEGEKNAFELQALQDTISEIKLNIHPQNSSKFENGVEAHMQHILSGLSHMGNLHAFTIKPTLETKTLKQEKSALT